MDPYGVITRLCQVNGEVTIHYGMATLADGTQIPLVPEGPRALPPLIRGFLSWSYNYSTAQSLHEETRRHNAQWIATGIPRGQDQSDETLIHHFIVDRDFGWIGDEPVVDDDWVPSPEYNGCTLDEVVVAMKSHPDWDRIWAEAVAYRQQEDER